jgi:hypothetical protein
MRSTAWFLIRRRSCLRQTKGESGALGDNVINFGLPHPMNWKTPNREILFWLLLLFGIFGRDVIGQQVVKIEFDQLNAGQSLNEQFAEEGIHIGGSQPAQTIAAPFSLDPTGSTVGYSAWLTMLFDQPVTSVRARIAELSISPNYNYFARDSHGISIEPAHGGWLTQGQWSYATVTYSAGDGVRNVSLTGWSMPDENFLAPMYIQTLEVTFVPEPSTWAFILVGSGALLIFARRRGRAGG